MSNPVSHIVCADKLPHMSDCGRGGHLGALGLRCQQVGETIDQRTQGSASRTRFLQRTRLLPAELMGMEEESDTFWEGLQQELQVGTDPFQPSG